MARRLSLIIPSCTDAYLARLLWSIDQSSPGWLMANPERVVVADNGLTPEFREAFPLWRYVSVPEPFVFARAVNLAVAATDPETDLLILNDDARFVSVQALSRLEALPVTGYGVIGCQIIGGVGNPDQGHVIWAQCSCVLCKRVEESGGAGLVVETPITICFVAALIRREAWEAVGPMDEQFIYYGFDDADLCRRVVRAGWKLGVTGAAVVEHGFGPTRPMHGTYGRLVGAALSDWFAQNRVRFERKWGELAEGEPA